MAKGLVADGWDVVVVDESEDALLRLGAGWSGGFVVGHGMDTTVLEQAGAPEADAAVVSTDGDNTNVVIGQVLQKRYEIDTVVVRVLDPARAAFYERAGHEHRVPDADGDLRPARICPRGRAGRDAGALMYVVVAGGGKVGSNITRSLLEMGHEVTLIEQRADRFARLEESFGPVVIRGDATEISVLERAGIARPPELLLALTGDDEDNLVISQLGKEGYGVPKAIARVNNPRNQQHFDLLGITQTVCATTSILALVEHEMPEHGLVPLLELQKEGLVIAEVQVDGGSPAAGKRVGGLGLPAGSRLISVYRQGRTELVEQGTVMRPGTRSSRSFLRDRYPSSDVRSSAQPSSGARPECSAMRRAESASADFARARSLKALASRALTRGFRSREDP